jgi:hypothetical protein
MSRALSLAARQAVTAQETAEIFLILLSIEAPGMEEPIRVVNDHADCISRGLRFVAFPFEIALPGDDPDNPPTVTLRIDNVDRRIVAALRALDAIATVTIEVVRAAAPDEIEAGPFAMQLAKAIYTALAVEAELAFEDTLNARFPAGSYAPADYPGLF